MKLKQILLVITLAAAALLTTLIMLRPTDARAEVAVPATPLADFPMLADFEGGVPAGWFVYNGGGSNLTAFTEIISDADAAALPGQVGDNELLSTTFTVGDYAGFGDNFGAVSQNWASYDAFTFWFYGQNSGLSYQAEVFDGGSDADHAERWDYNFTDDFTGWRQIIIPFSAFNFATDFQPYPDDGILNLTTMWGWVFPLPIGASAFYLDNVAVTNLISLADFEGGPPQGWFVYNGGGSGITTFTELISDTSPIALPGQVGYNELLSTTFTIGDYAGFGADFGAVSQDWTNYDGLSFWFYGLNSGLSYQVEVFDGGSDADHAERWDYNFTDDFTGWQVVAVDFDMFNFATDFQPYPDDGILNLTTMWGWVFPLPGGASSFYLDNVSVYGDAGTLPLTVQFNSPTYSVDEAGTATIIATLNMTATYPVSVSYATADGSATAGADYTATAGTLIFPANTLTQSFTVDTIDDGALEGAETVLLTLSDPLSVTLGSPSAATLTIVDDEQPSPTTAKLDIVDDYELTELVSGMDGSVSIGWFTFNAPTAAAGITLTQVLTDGIPAPIPDTEWPNTVLQMNTEIDTGEWAGFVHAFANDAADTWTPQDWSGYEGVAFWLYGNNTGGTLFLDILDNRNPGSTSDDAERFSVDIPDDFSGWRYFEIPFGDFNRKDIGNGAPNDGLTLTEMHGYAFGAFGSVPMGAQANYIDQFALVVRVTTVDDYELTTLPAGMDGSASIGWFTFNAPAASAGITLTQTITDSPPEPVPGQDTPNTVLQIDTTVNTGEWAGFVHAFANEATDTWTPQDWSDYEGVCFWLYGNNTGGTLFLDILDNRNPGSTGDDAERFSVDIPDDFSGWRFFAIPFSNFNRKDIGNGAPNDGFTLTEVHGYAFGAFGSVPMGAQTNYLDQFAIYGNTGDAADLTVSFAGGTFSAAEGETAVVTVTLNMSAESPVSVAYRSAEGYATPDRDYTPAAGIVTIPAGETTATFTVATLDDGKYEGDENLMLVLSDPTNATLGFQYRAVLTIEDNEEADPALLHDFEGYHSFLESDGDVAFTITEVMSGDAMARPGQDTYERVLAVTYDTGDTPVSFTQPFVQGQDWSGYDGLSFWFYGSGSGESVSVNLLDNQSATTADVDPADWVMVWQDEFDGNAGTKPNPNIWRYEIGDGTLNGIPGWGNSESEYYTDSADNAALDGSGNLALTMQQVNTNTSDLACWYGPCEYTSARLISWDRMEYEYGRIEARIQVPDGGDGLWPAFWMLGTDLDEVGWPQSGEIDIMEYVSRIPTEIFGTIHGPGYSGGSAFGNTYDFGEPVANDYHTFAIEWGADEIHWYVDGTNYHNATPSDVAPNQWVYNHPFFLLLNLAIGGNFGGSIDPNLVFPQTMLVDYVRVYQAENTSERFTASFVDDVSGWRKVTLPFHRFVRAADQPDGAPDDGLTLTDVWGYGFEMPNGSSGTIYLDQVKLADLFISYYSVIFKP